MKTMRPGLRKNHTPKQTCALTGHPAKFTLSAACFHWSSQRHQQFKPTLASDKAVEVVESAKKTDLAPLDNIAKGSYEDASTFSTFANWLIPGRVLLGRYPYVEPGRCKTAEQGVQQLQRILEVGITTFVSLQAELPPQVLMADEAHGMLPYKNAAERVHASLQGMTSMEVVSGLRNETNLPATKLVKFVPLAFVHSPITDLGVPATTEELRPVLQELQSRLRKGEIIYLHCKAGRGRAGTVGACLLGFMYGIEASEALERVERAYNTRKISMGRSPETDEQQRFVQRFIEEVTQMN